MANFLLEDVLRQMPAAVVIVEAPTRRIVHANARARDMAERQLGRRMPPDLTDDWEILRPDGRPYAMDEWPLVRSITSGEKVVDEEYFNILADGSRLIVQCSSSPIYDDSGRIVAGVLIMKDITEEKRSEERLTYLSNLLDSLDDPVIAVDQGLLITAWTKGAERLYGWAVDEVLGLAAGRVGIRPPEFVVVGEGERPTSVLVWLLVEDDQGGEQRPVHLRPQAADRASGPSRYVKVERPKKPAEGSPEDQLALSGSDGLRGHPGDQEPRNDTVRVRPEGFPARAAAYEARVDDEGQRAVPSSPLRNIAGVPVGERELGEEAAGEAECTGLPGVLFGQGEGLSEELQLSTFTVGQLKLSPSGMPRRLASTH